MNDLKLFWLSAAGLVSVKVRPNYFLHLEKYY